MKTIAQRSFDLPRPAVEALEPRQHFAAYKIVDFGPGSYAIAFGDIINGVNSSGEAVGTLPLGGDVGFRGTAYGVGVELPSLGGINASAQAINDAGTVVGDADTPKETNHIALWTVSKKNKVSVTDLGSFDKGKGGGVALTINASGQVGGSAGTKSERQHAFIYSAHKLTDLGTLTPTGNSVVTSLSDNGLAVGLATDSAGKWRDVTFKKGAHIISGLTGTPHANSNGWIAAGDKVLEGKKLVSLGTISDPSAILPPVVSGMNNQNEIIGTVELTNRNTPFVWKNGIMTDLNTLIPANSGWRLDNVYGISSDGRIVGEGFLGGGSDIHIFELVPTAKAKPKAITRAASPAVATAYVAQSPFSLTAIKPDVLLALDAVTST